MRAESENVAPDPEVGRPRLHPSSGGVVNVRFMTAFPHCNYSCTYCIAGHGEAFTKRPDRWDPERYLRIIDNLTKLPFRINVRLGVEGEFFLDKTMVDGARRLSLSANTTTLNLITNLSFRYAQYKKLFAGFREEKIAIIASFHPTEVKDHDAWIETAVAMAADYDLVAILVAYPPLLDRIAAHRGRLVARKIETFVQPFIGPFGGQHYPSAYTEPERAVLKSVMYSRHDVEYLLNLKRPGLCNAGYRSVFVNPEGLVFPCGMGAYPTRLGNLAESPALRLRSGAAPCPFDSCQCDTENLNTVQFGDHYERLGKNQHRYRFRTAALGDERLDEWKIPY